MTAEERIRKELTFLYGEETSAQIWPRWSEMLSRYHSAGREKKIPDINLSEKDAILITYGDQFQQDGTAPLGSLYQFLEKHLKNVVSAVHILPFYPYSSDDGFSVIDYRQVNPDLGKWSDIDRIGSSFRLMFDAVINHISRHSNWFQAFLKGEEPYLRYFITVDPQTDLSQVVRPRALPLLTAVETASGVQHVWTTFSDDQIDLNYAEPQVMLEIADLLLTYSVHGAEIIRLDAIAYLWKEIGTSCIHLPQTYAAVRLFRAVLDAAAPNVILITETNVPHQENISYFGSALPDQPERGDQAQMVYQFPLAPLVLHAFQQGDARVLSRWASGLETPFPGSTFFNFIASHDGIGVRPAEGLLTPAEIQSLADQTLAHGGRVSYKTNSDGTQSAYELNITLYDALNDPTRPEPEVDQNRFLASQSVMLSLAGVPGIYVHSLFGSRNCQECLQETGRARSINREKFNAAVLEACLADPSSREARILKGYTHLLIVRAGQPAFHPQSAQEVLNLHPQLFCLLRAAQNGQQMVWCIINVSNQMVELPSPGKPAGLPEGMRWRDLLDPGLNWDGKQPIQIAPYQSLWLEAQV